MTNSIHPAACFGWLALAAGLSCRPAHGQASPPQRGDDSRPPQPRVYQARVQPHWFASNTRFWYRNDLRGGGREFILVDAINGTRERAFDHEAVARQISSSTEGLRLPVEELRFSDSGQSVLLRGSTGSWELDLTSGRLREGPAAATPSRSRGLVPEGRPRPSSRTGAESEITFENQLGEEVQLFWLDTQGQRQSYGTVAAHGRRVQHTYAGHVWLAANSRGQTLAVFEAAAQPDVAVIDGQSVPTPAPRRPRNARRTEPQETSPNGQWSALVKDHNLFLRGRGGEEVQLSTDGGAGNSYTQWSWAPDSRTLVAWRTEAAESREVHLVRSSPEGGGRARLESRPYALPGDPFRRHELNLFDVATRQQLKPAVERFEHGWLTPRVRWNRGGTGLLYEQADRGHQRFRVLEVSATTGEVRSIIDERSDTFIWTAHTENLELDLVNWLQESDELIYVSERDGWRHLYLVDTSQGTIRNQITQGPWVVRGIQRIDEARREIWFSASGRHPEQDPYFLHYYRVRFDGTGLVALTAANGNHSIEFSPDGRYLIDTWSRVDFPPVNELRRASDGALVCSLEQADATELLASNWVAPEPFVAKGRDGRTDIYGVIHWPQPRDPDGKYPVIESIYAGPQGSFVPKSFQATRRFRALTEMRFVVVQIDGMGTANRSKAFHDVCYRNLRDAGFPDRILWMQAAAAKYPCLDLSRVGIYGNSAGGQNAAAAVLFHSHFYKAAVASCGCHDNRLDKASWNEQWMGYMPPEKIWEADAENWYSRSSNIDNAFRLGGKLFLIVGEMDTNVPPESTLRFVDALIRADQSFDLLVIPNGGHGMGGAYGERRMREFFQRHLLDSDGGR